MKTQKCTGLVHVGNELLDALIAQGSVLVWAAVTRCHTLCGCNNRGEFLPVPEANSPRSGC